MVVDLILEEEITRAMDFGDEGDFESGELEGFGWCLAANIDTGEIVRVVID